LQQKPIRTIRTMSKVYFKVELNVTADCDGELYLDDIMGRIDISAVGDGEFVDVEDCEVTNFYVTNIQQGKA